MYLDGSIFFIALAVGFIGFLIGFATGRVVPETTEHETETECKYVPITESEISTSMVTSCLSPINESIADNILRHIALATAPMVTTEIAELVGISTQKASAICRALVGKGALQMCEIKVPRRGAMKGYFLPN